MGEKLWILVKILQTWINRREKWNKILLRAILGDFGPFLIEFLGFCQSKTVYWHKILDPYPQSNVTSFFNDPFLKNRKIPPISIENFRIAPLLNHFITSRILIIVSNYKLHPNYILIIVNFFKFYFPGPMPFCCKRKIVA